MKFAFSVRNRLKEPNFKLSFNANKIILSGLPSGHYFLPKSIDLPHAPLNVIPTLPNPIPSSEIFFNQKTIELFGNT